MASQAQQGGPALEEMLKSLIEQQATRNKQMVDQQQVINQQISAQNTKLEQMMTQMMEMGVQAGKSPVNTPHSPAGSPHSLNRGNEDGFGDESGMLGRLKEPEPMVRPSIMYNSRIEFPQFDGTNPRSWLKSVQNTLVFVRHQKIRK